MNTNRILHAKNPICTVERPREIVEYRFPGPSQANLNVESTVDNF